MASDAAERFILRSCRRQRGTHLSNFVKHSAKRCLELSLNASPNAISISASVIPRCDYLTQVMADGTVCLSAVSSSYFRQMSKVARNKEQLTELWSNDKKISFILPYFPAHFVSLLLLTNNVISVSVISQLFLTENEGRRKYLKYFIKEFR